MVDLLFVQYMFFFEFFNIVSCPLQWKNSGASEVNFVVVPSSLNRTVYNSGTCDFTLFYNEVDLPLRYRQDLP